VVTAEPPDRPRSTDLPATYQNPWGLLGQDLKAVVADLGLQLRALWRRNRAGELSVPAFWPRPLQALFWPLLLALLLALPWIGWRLLSHGPGSAAAPGPQRPLPPAEALQPAPPQAPQAPQGSTARVSLGVGAPPAADLGAAAPQAVSPPAVSPQAVSLQAVSPQAAAMLPGERAATAAPLALDPLLQLLAEADPGPWIVSAHPEPALALLRLTLGPAFAELPAASRRQWVDRWCQKAQELGYERFELVDEQQRPLGRKALVGSGMILLDPVPKV
jgi:hypothetical protein